MHAGPGTYVPTSAPALADKCIAWLGHEYHSWAPLPLEDFCSPLNSAQNQVSFPLIGRFLHLFRSQASDNLLPPNHWKKSAPPSPPTALYPAAYRSACSFGAPRS
ncbi:hypothetical protein D3C76_1398740 [compost metagenome]